MSDDPAYEMLAEMRAIVGEQRDLLNQSKSLAATRVASAVIGALPRAIDRALAVSVVVLLVVTAGLTVIVCYWLRPDQPAVYGVRAGFEQCSDRADGSKLCWLPIWVPAPPAPKK
jgi:hypothetical protein